MPVGMTIDVTSLNVPDERFHINSQQQGGFIPCITIVLHSERPGLGSEMKLLAFFSFWPWIGPDTSARADLLDRAALLLFCSLVVRQ